jgi:hypothetical protein
MSNFDFIPNNPERNTADMNVVALFLKAFMDKEEFVDSGWGHTSRLTADGKFVRHDGVVPNEVKFKWCDVEYAFKVLKEKGYFINVSSSPKGISRWYTLHTTKKRGHHYL